MEVQDSGDVCFSDAVTELQADMKAVKSCSGSNGIPPASSSCFDCNICLDSVIDPVVTLCGHLYCWPCIFKWLQVEGSYSEGPQQCPVCKASISENTMVPLYGRGRQSDSKKHNQGLIIPCRPSIPQDHVLIASGVNSQVPRTGEGLQFTTLQSTMQRDYPFIDELTMTSAAGELLGGMAFAVLPWVFHNQQHAARAFHSNEDDYGDSLILRPHDLEEEKKLQKILLCLFCFAGLCFLLF